MDDQGRLGKKREKQTPAHASVFATLLIPLISIPAAEATAQGGFWPTPDSSEAAQSVEISAGLYIPNTFEDESRDLGWILAGRLGSPIHERLEAFIQYTFAAAEELGQGGTHPDFVIIGLEEQTFTVGADYAVRGDLRMELAAGVMARGNVVSEVHGDAPPEAYPDGTGGEGSWSAAAVIVPALSWRAGTAVLRLRNMLILDDATGINNLSLSLGIRF